MCTTDAMPMVRLLEWRPISRGSLRGFARIRLGDALTINEVCVFQGNERPWAGLPGRPVIGSDGLAVRDSNGRQRYVPLVEWTNREASNRFSEAVIAEIQREHGAAAFGVSEATDEGAEKPAPQRARPQRNKVAMPEGDPVPF